jgi:hypothetical protein
MAENINVTPVKVIDESELNEFRCTHCIVCFKNIVETYKNPTDCTIRLFKGDEKTSYCEAVENYLSITISKGKDFNVICKSCHRSISLALKITQQRKESLLKGRRAVHEKIRENRSKRELPTDVVITSNPRRRRLGLDLSIENTTNAEMDQTVSVLLILGYFYK